MPPPSKVTDAQVAQWMVEELDRVQYLYQQDAVYGIETRFGEPFYYLNESGNPAISKKVLAAFKKLTGDAVIWERGERMWRRRTDYDEAGRQQY